jgi:hypothetical protein
MRVGDFSVEVIGAGSGTTKEVESGHVLARPGQVYVLRLRNHGPLRCVVDASIDGHGVTSGGLVINAWGSVDLERPIHESERGRFTVIAEGDERVFGPDGGRDNPDLGLIEARFRRELPPARPVPMEPPNISRFTRGSPVPDKAPASPGPTPGRPLAPPEWTPFNNRKRAGGHIFDGAALGSDGADDRMEAKALFSRSLPVDEPIAPPQVDGDAIERAAGTGLTGSSSQDFVPVHVGTLETEATVIRLRIVIGTEEAISAPRPLPASDVTPARPVARP